MSKLIITVGLPASGKSTWAETYKHTHKNVEIVCKYDVKRPSEVEVKRVRDEIIGEFLSLGKTVISADCNLNPVHISHMKNLFGGHTIEIVKFKVDPKTCIKRDLQRSTDKQVGPSVINSMYKQYHSYLK